MSDQTLVSYAQNGEDVVLWRALGHVTNGRYLDVGAWDPVEHSVTKALYDRGWRGIEVEPVPAYADGLREARAGNEVVQAAITDRPGEEIDFHMLVGTGLSTLIRANAEAHEKAGFERRDITVPVLTLDAVCKRSAVLGDDLHVLKVDVEGAESEVLRTLDLARWKPWVAVVEATRPLSSATSYDEWDPLLTSAGYTCTLFDGLNRFYVSPEHQELADKLSYPACVLDDYVPVSKHRQDLKVDQLTQQLEEARQDALRWRNQAVGYWAQAMARVQTIEDEVKRARSRAERASTQVGRARDNLQRVRVERNKLRAEVKRLRARIGDLERGQEAGPPPRGQLRAALKRVTRQ